MSLPLVDGQGNFGSIDGDPAAAITVFLHVFGDYNNIGINFFEPKKFLKNQISTLDDYDLGNSKIEEITELKTKYNDKGWIFIDPFILHQTFKKSNSLRISLSVCPLFTE